MKQVARCVLHFRKAMAWIKTNAVMPLFQQNYRRYIKICQNSIKKQPSILDKNEDTFFFVFSWPQNFQIESF